MGEDNEGAAEAGARLLHEVQRVLDVERGVYLCVTLVQPHVLSECDGFSSAHCADYGVSCPGSWRCALLCSWCHGVSCGASHPKALLSNWPPALGVLSQIPPWYSCTMV